MLSLGPAGGWVLAALVLVLVIGVGWWIRPRRGAASAPPRLAPASEPSTPSRRATIGPYRIERELGRGAMGMVYLGQDPRTGAAVAIKTMALAREFEGPELADARARFFREAELAGRLRHPDIVATLDAGEDQGLAYLAMDYVAGHDLLRHTGPGQLLPVPVVLRTVARIARALAYAHTQGIVHRDVKPANVLLDPASGAIKVADFGIARITDGYQTRSGVMLGTPSYMSPEQMAGRPVDGRSDLYSLGVMLFQLLTGALPHRSESMAELFRGVASEPAPDVRALRPELPQALAEVVALALEKRPELRYADGGALASDLLEVAQAIADADPAHAAAAVASTPDSGGSSLGAEVSRHDPRHNAGH
jgi:serine/threonine protein kinase